MKVKLSVILSVSVAFIMFLCAFNAYADDVTVLDDNNISITVTESYIVYNGKKQKPAVEVYYGDVLLESGTDYKVSYSDNIDASKNALITVKGRGDYSGTVTKNFTIMRHPVNDDDIKVKLSYESVKYSGTEKKPKVTVSLGKKELEKTKDYTVEYSNNIEPGKGTVKIIGKGNYSGATNKNFDITALSLKSKKADISLSKKTYIYNGKKKTPSVTVTYSKGDIKNTLLKDTDYTVEYKNNTNTGKATAVITGINHYRGTVKVNYEIKPRKVNGFKASKSKENSLELKWKKSDGNVSGYEILKYSANSKKYEHYCFVGANTTSKLIEKLSNGTVYKFKIKAYKEYDKSKHYGKESKIVTTATKPARVNITSATKNKEKGTVTVKWTKVNATGYEIFYTTDKKFKKNIKTLTIEKNTKTKKTFKDLDTEKDYYFKVRAYKEYDGKVKYGKKSAMLGTYFSNVYATYYSWYENNPPRTNNLRIASKAISGTILQPGDVFDFNKIVGARTASKGYKNAHIFQGEEIIEGIGGGVCQVASTLFNCTLKANLQIVERHQHDQRVWYVPLGRDAAIYGNAENYRFKNNTKNAIKIKMSVKGGKITATFYTCTASKPKKVKLNVYQNGKHFTLKRTVGGKVNYTTSSYY
jgi:hypothetical protein